MKRDVLGCGVLIGLAAGTIAACAFVPRQVDIAKIESRIHVPQASFAAVHQVAFGAFDDRRPNRERLGVARNKLMMVTTTVGMSGDLAAVFERVVRRNLAAQGIGEGPSPIVVSGAVLDATTDATGPDHVFVEVVVSVSVVDSTKNTPVLHQTLRGRHVSGVTQVTSEAWEDAFVGAMNQINRQVEALAAAGAKALATAKREDAPRSAAVSGSCVVVHPDGLVLTAHHVIEGARALSVRLGDGRVLKATVLQADPSTDLSLLQVRGGELPYLPLAPIRSARIGQYVFTIGYPAVSVLGPEPKFTEGSVSALSGPQGVASLLQVSVPVQPGNSGGPLVNEAGELVAVVTSTASVARFLHETGTLPQNINWAVKGDYARTLFETPQAPARARNREEAIERTKSAACFVEGTK